MSEKGFYTGKWSIREDGAIVSEVGGYEIFGAHGIADMVAYLQSLGLKHATVSKDLFYQFVHESLRMAVSPQPYTHEGKLRYMGFDVFQEKDGGEDKAIVNSPAREIEAPERAVVGYEEPKPIDTIEKKHELRIKNLEAYNKYQAERNQQIMDLNPHVDFCDSEGNLVRPSRMTALEARVKELEDQLFKLLGSKNG